MQTDLTLFAMKFFQSPYSVLLTENDEFTSFAIDVVPLISKSVSKHLAAG